jgi:arylsulfatase A-like enzyme
MSRGLNHLEIEPRENGMLLAKRAHAWVTARDQRGDTRPLFLWMHLIEPHNWFYGSDPHSDDERRRLYDRSLQQSDQMLAELLNAFASRRPERAPIVIVSADHGEALGDHGQPNHSTDLYDSQIRVPLVIAGPGIAPRRIAETVSLTDLAPSLVELAGFEAPRNADGASFADLATGRRQPNDEAGTAFAAMIKDRSNPGGITAVVKGRWKLVDAGSNIELYDVHTDPGERANQLAGKPMVVEELKRLLEKYVKAGEESPFE